MFPKKSIFFPQFTRSAAIANVSLYSRILLWKYSGKVQRPTSENSSESSEPLLVHSLHGMEVVSGVVLQCVPGPWTQR